MSTAVAPGMPRAHDFRGSEKGKAERNTNGFFIEEEDSREALSESSSIGAASSDSSSIGENSSSEKGGAAAEEEEGEEVESKVNGVEEGLGTLESLEDALPIKRGISNFYAGKSKSFTSLAEAAATAAANEIAKPENPFNKRRRVLAAWSRRRASCSSLVTTYLPPLLAPDHAVVEEDEEEECSDNEEDQEHQCNSNGGKSRREKKVPTFPPPRLSLHTQKVAMMRSPNATPLDLLGRSPCLISKMQAITS